MTDTVARLSTAPDPVEPLRRSAGPIVVVRRWWRLLTSMRTALVLLFLLAVAAVPGSLLPQRSLNQSRVSAYYAEHPDLAPILDRLSMFDVFSSPWFAAIYLLLFVSLIGCVVPRTRMHFRAVRQPPPPVPSRLERLPQSATFERDLSPAAVADAATAALRRGRWRVVRRRVGTGGTRVDDDGTVELSAEKGYLREVGNLAFHGALVALLAGLAVGKLNGYEGSILVEEGSGFCNSFQQYDTYRNGPFAGAGDLTPLCADLDRFSTEYEDNLIPARFLAELTYTREIGGPASTYPLEVNSPLRTDGVRLYLTGHGYSPRFTITYPDGSELTDISAPFLPEEQTTLASTGALKLPDRPGAGAEDPQLAIEGFFVPTAANLGDNRLVSVDPRPLNPAVAIVVYQGSIGLDSGAPQNVFRLDQRQIDRGVLERVAAGNLLAGQSLELPDGTEIRFEGYKQWAALQLSHDPGQLTVLIASVVMLLGLLCSLVVRRRRLWLRCRPADPAAGGAATSRTVVNVGGLSRADSGSFDAEFAALVKKLVADSSGRN
ncbi:MAG: cytochrome c biogenesis protein ResB [Geodermatophilaceae bacterium]|nr:cytochrome c biogenesis protein ResB [Geodermatophilaceae bacterium]